MQGFEEESDAMHAPSPSPAARREAIACPLAVVIVNHEHAACVQEQLRAYYNQSPLLFSATDWLVIHNGPDPFPDWSFDDPELREAFSQISVHRTPNNGYGAAVNEALRLSTAPFVLALNADLLPEPGFLDGVHALLRREAELANVGVIGCRLLNVDGTLQGSAGRFPWLGSVVAGLFRPRSVRKYLTLSTTKPAAVPWVTGAAVLISRRCTEAIGVFDESFFMYYEDVDFCRRAWQAGWRVEYRPELAVRHLYPYHSRSLTLAMVSMARHGLLRYFWKNRPRWEFRLLGQIMLCECRYRRLRAALAGSANVREWQGWHRLQEMIRQFIRDPEHMVYDHRRHMAPASKSHVDIGVADANSVGEIACENQEWPTKTS